MDSPSSGGKLYKWCLFLQVNLGPDKMVIDLRDSNRPRFTLQELRDVLQERNKLKSQLLVVQEELQCYKRWGSCTESQVLPGIPPYVAYLFLRSFNDCTPGTIPGTGEIAVNKRKSMLV